ncbi:hypothetical protein POX_a00328 [Penicillium oxalicum]|uniref:hypothetical protein n=1 Tax=Penicillium oxalicum TaxID=69781 RepID=UPI0020B65BF2|nr:hypothetical protein POX_a00328 [Penicillium oxalicum]KAI2793744.1 hypothetical protein POX_a00328 [Penicillium oxalicum]
MEYAQESGLPHSESTGLAPKSPETIFLDGSTLEGGGQLVRIAICLSALIGRAVVIKNIRANRLGKTGLKGSHEAAIKLLAEISGSQVTNVFVGSKRITFTPPQAGDMANQRVSLKTQPRNRGSVSLVSLESISVKSQYRIRMHTAGSICLIFQALYPYMLHVGRKATTEAITINIVGGTNGSGCPSYDYVSQVVIPNFARLGLPPLSIGLHKRGWTTGPHSMGEMSFVIQPLQKDEETSCKAPSASRFPHIDMTNHERGRITRIDITVLAPSDTLEQVDEDGLALTVMDYIIRETHRRLRKALKTLDSSPSLEHSARESNRVPIKIYLTEPTFHYAQVSILLVAHTANGFRIGCDSLLGDTPKTKGGKKNSEKHQMFPRGQRRAPNRSNDEAHLERVSNMIDNCVNDFLKELAETLDDTRVHGAQGDGEHDRPLALKLPCLDSYMRDQIVIFEALGRLGHTTEEVHDKVLSEEAEITEHQRYWTLHTKTAQWVCEQMLSEI